MMRLKIISLYIYKDLRLRILGLMSHVTIVKDLRSDGSRDHCHKDGNLVPSPRCGFSFEAAFQL